MVLMNNCLTVKEIQMKIRNRPNLLFKYFHNINRVSSLIELISDKKNNI